MNSDEQFMCHALNLAQQAAELNEVPVGAVVVLNDEIIGEGFNQPISRCDPTAHAEIIALRNAALKMGNYRLQNATLYVTIEPCAMCAGALIHARVARLVYGALEPKAGSVKSTQQLLNHGAFNHQVEYLGGVLAQECGDMMSHFFKKKRDAFS